MVGRIDSAALLTGKAHDVTEDKGQRLQHNDDPIPLVDDLETLYAKARLPQEGERWDMVCKQFAYEFGGERPQYIARAPGRVNLMGDHVDHMRFGCMPAALEMDILMAFRVVTAAEQQNAEAGPSSQTDRISFHVKNTTARFAEAEFDSSIHCARSVDLTHEGPTRWANYIKVAFKGLHPHLPIDLLDSPSRPARIEILVGGTIPPESSLSSSAAMTCCSSIVILEAFQARQRINRREMTEVAIESERFVGVASGGMDQAASIFGVRGSALHVNFVPRLAVEPVKIPDSKPPHVLVIANTLVVCDKKVTGPVQYNLRVGELRMACRVLAKELGLPTTGKDTALLKPLMDTYFDKHGLQIETETEDVKYFYDNWGEEAAKLAKMRNVALAALPQEPQKREQVEKLSGYEDDAFHKEFLSEFPIRADTFDLYKRVRHVFNESLNVVRFKFACREEASTRTSDQTYQYLGHIMHDSQQTLFNDYENGCAELEQVCSIAESAGALGSRPTGAGWGGSTVSLVPECRVDDVLTALRTRYYDPRFEGGISEEQFGNAVVVSQPAAGACVYKV